MKRILFFVLLLVSVAANSQLMQTNGTPGGYQWVAGKWDSLHIIPRGTDTPNIGGTKYGKSTVGAMFFKTTDSTLWIRSANKWNQVTGTGGGGSGSGITSLGQGYGVIIANDSTYNVDSSLFISVQHFYNTVDSIINIISNTGIDSIVVNSPLTIDFTNRQVPVISYTGDTTRYFVFESPIQANVYGDTVYVYLDTTLLHTFPYLETQFYPLNRNPANYLTGDSANGRYMDTSYYRTGPAVDSFFYAKNGTEYFWYTNPATDRVIYGGIVTWTGTDLDYYVTACYFRKNGIYYLTNDTTVTLPPLADADSSRSDVFIVQTLSDTDAQTTTITGTESANPVTPQIDGNTDLYLTHVTLNPGQTTGLTDTLIVYDNLSGGEFEYRSSTGVTTNFSNTTNVYRVPYSVDVSAINNNDIIGFGTETQRNALNYLGLSFFIKLKTVMPNSNGMLVSLWNNGVQVSNEVGIPFNRTNLNYQGFSVPMTTFGMSNALFDSVRFRYAGGGAGISGMYIDFVYFQGNLNPGGPTTDGNVKWVTQGTGIIIDSISTPTVYKVSADTNLLATQYYVDSSVAAGGGSGSVEYVVSGLGTQVDSSGRAYTVNVDTSSSVILSRQRAANTYVPLIRTVTAGVGLLGGGALSSNITLNVDTFLISTRAWRDKLADSLGALIALKGTGTVTSLTQGYGILNSTNPITTTGTQRIDTFAISTRAWRDKLADSLGVIIATKQPQLSGTGYVKMSGTTPSYDAVIPIAGGGTNNGSLSVTNGNLLYTDGTKVVGLGVGTSKQHLVGGTLPQWVDTATASGGSATASGSTGNVQFKGADGNFSSRTIFTYDSTNARLGIGTASPASTIHAIGTSGLPTLGSELLSSSGWTSTNWTGSFGAGWTHTSGNTTALTNTLAAVVGTGYYITCTVSGGASNSFTVTFGGVSSNSISGTGTFTISIVAISTGTLSIAPTSPFDRTIVISIKAITGNSTPIASFANGTNNPVQLRSDTLTNVFLGYNTGGKTIAAASNANAGVTGSGNTGIGYNAIPANVSGGSNTVVGANAMLVGTYAGENTVVGYNALAACTSCGGATNGNVAVGVSAGSGITTATRSVAVGNSSLGTNAANVTAVGWSAGLNATAQSTYVGNQSGSGNSGSSVAAFGYQAGLTVGTTAASNIAAFGIQALNRSNGVGNTGIGYLAMSNAGSITHTGTYNTSLGFQALYSASTVISGGNNIGIGASADLPDKTASNQIVFQSGQSSGTGGYNSLTRFTGGQWLINNTTSAVTSAPNASAALEINGTTGGFVNSRQSTTQRNAMTAATGLQVYNSTLKYPEYYDGTSWQGQVGMTFGTAAPSSTPVAIGNFFLDTTNKKLYIASGTASSADWNILN